MSERRVADAVARLRCALAAKEEHAKRRRPRSASPTANLPTAQSPVAPPSVPRKQEEARNRPPPMPGPRRLPSGGATFPPRARPRLRRSASASTSRARERPSSEPNGAQHIQPHPPSQPPAQRQQPRRLNVRQGLNEGTFPTTSSHSCAIASEMSRSPRLTSHDVRELEDLYEFIGTKAAMKFKTVHKCLLAIEQGEFPCDSIRAFILSLNAPLETVDRFFCLAGNLSRKDFGRQLSKHIQPGYRQSSSSTAGRDAAPDEVLQGLDVARKSSARSRSVETPVSVDRFGDSEALLSAFCEKMREKHKSIRDAFRRIDEDKNGVVSRDEFSKSVAGFGLPCAVVDRVFALLDRDHVGKVSYQTFSEILGPVLQPGYRCRSHSLCADARTPDSDYGSQPHSRGQSKTGPSASTCSADSGKRVSRSCATWSHAQRSSAHKCQQPPRSTSSACTSTTASSSGRESVGSAGSRCASIRRRGDTCVTPRGDTAWFVAEPPAIPLHSATYDSNVVAAHLGSHHTQQCGSSLENSWRGPMLAGALMA